VTSGYGFGQILVTLKANAGCGNQAIQTSEWKLWVAAVKCGRISFPGIPGRKSKTVGHDETIQTIPAWSGKPMCPWRGERRVPLTPKAFRMRRHGLLRDGRHHQHGPRRIGQGTFTRNLEDCGTASEESRFVKVRFLHCRTNTASAMVFNAQALNYIDDLQWLGLPLWASSRLAGYFKPALS
jgi:hypothetical protein